MTPEVHIVLYAHQRRLKLAGIYGDPADAERVRRTLAGNNNEVFVYTGVLTAHQNAGYDEPDEILHRKPG